MNEKKICLKCKKTRRLTQFSLKKDADKIEDIYDKRRDTCRPCNYDGLRGDQRYLILREAYRHYLTFEQHVADTGQDTLEYAIPKEDDSDEYTNVILSFLDLQRALKIYNDGLRADNTVLSKRKEQAFYLNVICDLRQKDVAEIMKIRTVTVGQYVDAGMMQLAEYYFSEADADGTLKKIDLQEENE